MSESPRYPWLDAEEHLVATYEAKYAAGASSHPGSLHLTTRRLVFTPREMEWSRGAGSVEILLDQIKAVSQENSGYGPQSWFSGRFTRWLRVDCANNVSYWFEAQNLDTILAQTNWQLAVSRANENIPGRLPESEMASSASLPLAITGEMQDGHNILRIDLQRLALILVGVPKPQSPASQSLKAVELAGRALAQFDPYVLKALEKKGTTGDKLPIHMDVLAPAASPAGLFSQVDDYCKAHGIHHYHFLYQLGTLALADDQACDVFLAFIFPASEGERTLGQIQTYTEIQACVVMPQ